MPTETTPAAPPRVQAPPARPTLNTIFAECVRRRPDRPALRRRVAPGAWEDISWRAYRDEARRIGLGLMKLGLEVGDRVAILSNSRVEWVFADMGVLGAGGVVVPVYQNVREDEAAYILADSGARFVFVEDHDQLAKVAKARAIAEHAGLKKLEKAIVFDPAAGGKPRPGGLPDGFALTLGELGARGDGSPAAFEKRSEQAKADDLITLVYTSGTTGRPKGVMLTHQNAVAECDALEVAIGGSADDEVVLSFLPLAHIFARGVHWCALKAGYQTVYTSIATAAEDMREVRPTVVPSVPRFFEKVHASVMRGIDESPSFKRRYARKALAWTREWDRRVREGRELPLALALRRAVARPAIDALVAKLRAATGGRIRAFVSGGAPLSREIAEFFHSLGFLILEGYGLTETTAGTHVNRIGRYRLGTVGTAIPGLETKIAQDGEILVRGPIIMKGYYNKPDATKEVFDPEGWFHTGDIGEMDEDGFLRITDRKKDLIKTAGGKYVAPQNLENLMKTIPGISQFAVFGDQRKYCVALVTLDVPACKRLLEDAGAPACEDPKELAKSEAVSRHLSDQIAAKNAELPSYETIKYFRVVPRDFEVGDELTPTLKVKRKHVAEKYKALIEEMYKDKE